MIYESPIVLCVFAPPREEIEKNFSNKIFKLTILGDFAPGTQNSLTAFIAKAGNGSRSRDIDLGNTKNDNRFPALIHIQNHIILYRIKNYAAGLPSVITTNHIRPHAGISNNVPFFLPVKIIYRRKIRI